MEVTRQRIRNKERPEINKEENIVVEIDLFIEIKLQKNHIKIE
jgi:hypothetical protein